MNLLSILSKKIKTISRIEMIFKQIETERLILRPITIADDQDFFELDSNPKVHVYLENKPVTTIEESQSMIANILQQYKANGFALQHIEHIRKTSVLRGNQWETLGKL